MKSSILLPLLGLASCVAALPELQPLITEAPSPELLWERENEIAPSVMGFFSSNSTFLEVKCPKGYYSAAGRHAGCVTDNNRPVATGCENKTLVAYPNGEHAGCGTSLTCSHHTIWDDLDTKTAYSRWACFSSASTSKYILYRATTHSATTTSTTSDSTSETASTGSKSETAASATATSDEGQSGGDSKSMAWIAGPVVGGVAGLAIIGLLVWVVLLLKRRNKNKHEAEAQAQAGVPGAGPGHNFGGHSAYGSPPMSQAYATPAPAYVDPNGEPYKYYPQAAQPGGYAPVPHQASELSSVPAHGSWSSPAPSELPASESMNTKADAVEMGDSHLNRR